MNRISFVAALSGAVYEEQHLSEDTFELPATKSIDVYKAVVKNKTVVIEFSEFFVNRNY